jgi:hypothetical protein
MLCTQNFFFLIGEYMRNLLALSILSVVLVTSTSAQAFRGGAGGGMNRGGFDHANGGQFDGARTGQRGDSAEHIQTEAQEHTNPRVQDYNGYAHPAAWNNRGLNNDNVYVNNGGLDNGAGVAAGAVAGAAINEAVQNNNPNTVYVPVPVPVNGNN